MRMWREFAVIFAGLFACAASSQTRSTPQLEYLGEVGHLATPFDRRTSVTYRNIRVVLRPDGELGIEGRYILECLRARVAGDPGPVHRFGATVADLSWSLLSVLTASSPVRRGQANYRDICFQP